MNLDKDAALSRHFNALSHPRRARIFRMLIERPGAGKSFDHFRAETGYAASSLIHHLREMERCGLIRRKRKGQVVAYFLTPIPLVETIGAVLDLCRARPQSDRRAA
ncbi:MAG: winged helix-turn-helix transcriptional regulator [Rhodobacteraceae bacterium]|nr:winged helix-turn-helix transcriptional regulator [Paracoccaceae bacterium]